MDIKKSLLFIAIIFICQLSYAQQKPVLFGIKVSPNLGWIKPDSKGYENEGVKIGFSWGFMADVHLMENYDVMTGFNISYLNGSLKYPDIYNNEVGDMYRNYNLKYIEIPVSLKMKTNEYGNKFFFGSIGLGTNFLIDAKAKDSFNSPTLGLNEIEDYENIYKEIKNSRYSIILGVGMQYILGGSTSVITGINFNNGFSDILKDQNKVDPTIENAAINNTIEFYIGILF